MISTARALLALAIAVPAACKGCQSEPTPEITLSEAADKVIFASVEKLGAHHYIGRITRADSRDGTPTTSHEETVDLGWEDWDHFRCARLINGELASEVMVADGVPWVRKAKGRWDRRDDVEPHRVQLQATWDTWDEALEPFGDQVLLTEQGQELIEGRNTTRYAVSLVAAPKPEEKQKKKAATRSHFTPLSLSGTVWVDQATAVRLVGDVQGAVQQGTLTRTISLRFARSGFGEAQDIHSPEPARRRSSAERAVPP